jgi:hypothetical protein
MGGYNLPSHIGKYMKIGDTVIYTGRSTFFFRYKHLYKVITITPYDIQLHNGYTCLEEDVMPLAAIMLNRRIHDA